MSRVKKIVTSEVEGRNLSDFYGDNSYSFDVTGQINYYGENKMGPVIEPGIVYGSNADSGDGYGYNTIKLIPHAPDGQINDDRYLIIDPTAPNHIHIRAGGVQDASNSELILGAEQANVKVTDWNHQVQINTYNSGSTVSHNWTFVNDGTMYGPSEGGALLVTGIQNGNNVTNLPVYSSGAMTITANGGDMNFYMDGGMYIGPSEGGNQIVKQSQLVAVDDKTLPAGGTTGQVLTKVDETDYNAEWTNVSDVLATSTRWSPVFQATGLAFTGSNSTYPTYNSYYVKIGKMVTFNIAIDLSTVTNFGTGQFKTELPFLPIPTAANHFSAWAWIDPTQPADELNGHIQMVADHLPNSQVLDLHWLKETTATPKPLIESTLSQGNPVTFTTASKIYINGTYICQ